MVVLEIQRGERPLIVSLPHTGLEIPPDLQTRMTSPWLARKDADWWVERLYDFAHLMGATMVRTPVSRSVIDVNRDPTGASLYPGQSTTELCPTTTFDGEPLYLGAPPDDQEIAARREAWFDPYHAALATEITRLRARHPRVVLYEAHSIRSRIPRLFEGLLPHINLGTNDGASCDPLLLLAVESICRESEFSHIANGRFKGGWTTRRYGRPSEGVHALQVELACRSYLDEPDGEFDPDTWPPAYDPARAAPLRATLSRMLHACLDFAER
jgi:formiminoglutamase